MKKLITLLALVVATGVSAQVFKLTYTSFHIYDTINHKYTEGIQGKYTCYIDIDKSTMRITDTDGEEIYNFDILSTKAYDRTLANHCIRPADNNKVWDIYQITTDENRILKGKSGNLGWIFKVKIK